MTETYGHPVWRSLLYVPANNERFVAKAHTRGADAIILDMEDSVPARERRDARKRLQASAESAAQAGADILVRINSQADEAVQDIAAAVSPHVIALMVTKCRDAEHLRQVAALVARREAEVGMAKTTRLVPMIETASAYFEMREIAAADERNVAMLLGGEDFAMDAGLLPDGETLALPKQQVMYAARAAGLMPLGLMGTVADFTDLKGVRAAAQRARRFGMEGASCIHPSNVSVLNEAFTPSVKEVDHAKRAVNAYKEAQAQGKGAITVDSKMIDVPIVIRAERLLARMAAIEARDARKL